MHEGEDRQQDEEPEHGILLTYLGRLIASRWASLSFQNLAQVWVPWPWVSGLSGISTNLPCLICLTFSSAIPSSGGLMKSSAELTHIIGAVIRRSFAE